MNAPDDPFGHALMDWVRGGVEPEILERDDGFIETGAGPEVYLAPFERWPSAERQAMRYARGRVVDVGCGAGRVSLHLQDRGLDVVGLDASRLALRACRQRGFQELWHASVDDLAGRIESFDTVVLLGNNLGMFGSPERLRRALGTWAERAPRGARILAESTDPYMAAPAADRAYHRQNRSRDRMAGHRRLRIRYREWSSPWFDWLFVSRAEFRRLIRGTGWELRQMLGPPSDDLYVAILEKA